MNSFRQLLQQNRYALMFLAKFIGLYLVLNVLYGLYIESFKPAADPITYLVSVNAGYVASIVYDAEVIVNRIPETAYIDLRFNNYSVINVFEGCNGINVLIVFLAFIVALSPRWYLDWKFLLFAIGSIYFMNLTRVVLLFVIAQSFPDSLYFFHKFFFTGIIYAWVFLLWYLWVKRVKAIEQRT